MLEKSANIKFLEIQSGTKILVRSLLFCVGTIFLLGFFLRSVEEGKAAIPLLNERVKCDDLKNIRFQSRKIDEKGAFKGSVNYQLNSIVLCLGKQYRSSEKEHYARAVVEILLRYAKVVSSWPLIDKKGHAIDNPGFKNWIENSFWGGQHSPYVDLAISANLAKAYQMVADSKAIQIIGQEKGIDAGQYIREKLLRYLVDASLHVGRGGIKGSLTEETKFPFHNMDPVRLRALIVFGKIVDPAYIHIAVRFIRLFPKVGYFRDGFWHEGSLSYHYQVTNNLYKAVQSLKGYSDPLGYRHSQYKTVFGDVYKGVRGHLKNLDPLQGVQVDFVKINQADSLFHYPDGSLLPINETHTWQKGKTKKKVTHSKCLLGLRYCALVLGQGNDRTIVHLGYDGTNGHEHRDALNFSLWSHNMVLTGDGGYQKKPATKKWSRSTLSHNTVTINGLEQDSRFNDQERLSGQDKMQGIGYHLWQGYGHGNTNNQGDLLAADISSGAVQYLVVDAKRSYDSHLKVSRYERTLVLVKGKVQSRGQDDGRYLIDIFRIKGGNRHDWLFHGNLEEGYLLQTDLKQKLTKKKRYNALKGSLGKYLNVQKIYQAQGNWSSHFLYPHKISLKTFHLQQKTGLAFQAQGQAMKRKGTAPFLAIRQSGEESVFIKVHVPQSKMQEVITSVSFWKGDHVHEEKNQTIRLKIGFAGGRTDFVVIHDRKNVLVKLGQTALITHTVWSAAKKCLWHYQGDKVTGNSHWKTGIAAVKRILDKAPKNGFILENWQQKKQDKPTFFHLLMPNKTIESYQVKSITGLGGNRVFLETMGEPGLMLKNQALKRSGTPLVKHLYFPSRGYTGLLKYRTTTNKMSSFKGMKCQKR